MMLTIGTTKIGPTDHWEVRGRNEIWIWQNGEIVVLLSDSQIMSLLIREWQDENRITEVYEHGAGI